VSIDIGVASLQLLQLRRLVGAQFAQGLYCQQLVQALA
jgi:hypothetical protein